MSTQMIDILHGLYFHEIGTGGGCTGFVVGQGDKDSDDYILITDSDNEACAPTAETVHFSACRYSNETGEALTDCAMGLTFRQLMDWLRENPSDQLSIVDDMIVETALDTTTLDECALVIQTALGVDDGGTASIFFSGKNFAEITDQDLYTYMQFERDFAEAHAKGATP